MEPPKFWWRVTRDAVNCWLEHNAFSYAGSLAFYTLFSLAPTVIIAVAVIGVVLGEEAAQGQIVLRLQASLGEEVATAVQQAVAESRLEDGGVLPTVLGGGALLVGATAFFAQMQFSLNMLWGVTADPGSNTVLNFFKKRLLSLMVVLSIGIIMLFTLLLGVISNALLQVADIVLPFDAVLAKASEFLISFTMMTLMFAAIFKVLPDVVLGWRDVLLGAVVTALLFVLGRSAIAAYMAYTATASTYGAAGSVVMVLLWVYYSSLILLFGAAFTRSHLLAKGRDIIPRNNAVVVRRELLSH